MSSTSVWESASSTSIASSVEPRRARHWSTASGGVRALSWAQLVLVVSIFKYINHIAIN